MKAKSLNFIIPLVVYPFDIMVSMGESDLLLYGKLKKLGVDLTLDELDHSSTARGRAILFGGNQTLIRLYNISKTPEWYGNLAHEIFHAVEFILNRMGFKLSNDSDEAYAYLIDYITKEIHKRI